MHADQPAQPDCPGPRPTLLRKARVIDPASGLDDTLDLALDDHGRIAAIGHRLDASPAQLVVDASGLIASPGLIDPHVHLREPAPSPAETIEGATTAAVRGGFTTVVGMPNTTPPIDTPRRLRRVLKQARVRARCRVFHSACATVSRAGEQVADIAALVAAGAVAITDDGDCVADDEVMAQALACCRDAGVVFMQHAQDPALTRGASMHEGRVALALGLIGWPCTAEARIVERDIALARSLGARWHCQHVSCAETVELLRAARSDPRAAHLVSGEASPHHLTLTDESCLGFNTQAKMNPPLREARDVLALRQAVAEGVVTVLATDHAPHTRASKEAPFPLASFGIIGLETALPLYAEALVATGLLDWPALLEKMTINPARLCGLADQGLGQLREGGPADIALIDPDARWTFSAQRAAGRARNSPFDGAELQGKAVATFVAGRLAHCGLGPERLVRGEVACC